MKLNKNQKETNKMHITNSNGRRMRLTTAQKKIICKQPGYGARGSYMIAKTINGGKRLYRSVSGQWMDASLSDMVI